MFGEEVALTHGPYAHTATALTASEVLVFDAGELDDVIVEEPAVRESLVELLHMRDRPRRVSRILVHERVDDDGTEVRILKDAGRGAYYRLTADGWFLWQRLDGKHSLRELTLAYLGYARMFAPRLVANEVAELRAAGFVRGPRLRRVLVPRLSPWNRLVDRLRRSSSSECRCVVRAPDLVHLRARRALPIQPPGAARAGAPWPSLGSLCCSVVRRRRARSCRLRRHSLPSRSRSPVMSSGMR